jgi:hypothetical protein
MTARRHPDWRPDDADHCDHVLGRLVGLVDQLQRLRESGGDPADFGDALELVGLWARQGTACAYRSVEWASTGGRRHADR